MCERFAFKTHLRSLCINEKTRSPCKVGVPSFLLHKSSIFFSQRLYSHSQKPLDSSLSAPWYWTTGRNNKMFPQSKLLLKYSVFQKVSNGWRMRWAKPPLILIFCKILQTNKNKNFHKKAYLMIIWYYIKFYREK